MKKTLLFGKYKGHTIAEVLAHDPEYLQWLCSQDGFRNNRKNVYRDIIDCVEDSMDARIRKMVRAWFEDVDFCQHFLQTSGHAAILLHKLEVKHAKALEEITNRLRNLKEATNKAKNYAGDLEWARANGIFTDPRDRERQIAGFEQMITALHKLRERIPNQIEVPKLKTSCRFEQHGFDVVLHAAIPYPWGPELKKNYLGSHDDASESTVAIKIRWTVGDNYSATVQWIAKNRSIFSGKGRTATSIADHVVLLVGGYNGKNTTKEQFMEGAAAADIKVMFAADLEVPLERRLELSAQ
jgi:hypothetical protein